MYVMHCVGYTDALKDFTKVTCTNNICIETMY